MLGNVDCLKWYMTYFQDYALLVAPPRCPSILINWLSFQSTFCLVWTEGKGYWDGQMASNALPSLFTKQR